MVGYENERGKKKGGGGGGGRDLPFNRFPPYFPNVGSKARESTKATSLTFVLLDFQHVCVRKRA